MKKMLLLAMMAVAAVAFAAPAVASASGHFTHEGGPIDEPITTELTGKIGFESKAGSYECGAHPSATIETNSGTIKTLGLTTDDCKGTGAFAHCKLVAHELTKGSVLTPTANGEESDIDLKNFALTNVFETGYPGTGETADPENKCTVAGLPLELTFENITLEPDNHAAISSLTPSGNGVLEIEPSTVIAAVSAYGNLKVVEGQEGTIGIHTE